MNLKFTIAMGRVADLTAYFTKGKKFEMKNEKPNLSKKHHIHAHYMSQHNTRMNKLQFVLFFCVIKRKP